MPGEEVEGGLEARGVLRGRGEVEGEEGVVDGGFFFGWWVGFVLGCCCCCGGLGFLCFVDAVAVSGVEVGLVLGRGLEV